jgi:hypothetical protein
MLKIAKSDTKAIILRVLEKFITILLDTCLVLKPLVNGNRRAQRDMEQ